MEERLARLESIPFHGLTSRKLRKTFSLDGLRTAGCLAKGLAEALLALRRFKPDLVISTGGYVSAPVVLAQALRRGKVLVHEQNVVPGRTNRWLSRFASKVCLTFEDSAGHFAKNDIVVTGLPVRPELLRLPPRGEARQTLGLDADKFTLLVFGGSQGARRLNETVANSINLLRDLPVQVLHQTGEQSFEEVDGFREAADWDGYHVRDYLDDMASAYASADFALCRAGASTIAELTLVGLPAILVPYPHHKDRHQEYNARVVADAGGGIIVSDGDLSPETLVSTVRRFLASPRDLSLMADVSRSLAKPHAAEDIAAVAIQLVKGGSAKAGH